VVEFEVLQIAVQPLLQKAKKDFGSPEGSVGVNTKWERSLMVGHKQLRPCAFVLIAERAKLQAGVTK